jgi:hypothetical protein
LLKLWSPSLNAEMKKVASPSLPTGNSNTATRWLRKSKNDDKNVLKIGFFFFQHVWLSILYVTFQYCTSFSNKRNQIIEM